jgi:hypothetical protein
VNDLPVLLDDPIARPPRRGPATTISEPLTRIEIARPAVSPASRIRWPWWMAPARLVGRVHPRVLAASTADAIELRRLPRLLVELAPPVLVFVICAVVAISNASTVNANPQPHIDWLRLTTDAVYTESALFLLIIVALGAFSPALGVFLVAVFGVMDIAAATVGPYELRPFPKALVGRLIGVWLMWLLVVEIPILGRQLALSWRRISGNRFAVALLAGLVTGAFVWVWTQAALVLIRPVFTWSSIVSGVTLEAIQPMQKAGLVFAIVGGVVAGIGAFVRGPAGLLHEASAPARPTRTGPLAIVGRLARRVLIAAFLTIGLGGLISWQIEVIVLFAVLLGAEPLARFVADRTPLGMIVAALPPIARYAVAAAVSFGVAQVTIAPLYHFVAQQGGEKYPEFFSVVAAIAIGIVVVSLVTTPASRRRASATIASSAAVVLVLGGTLLLIVLTAPSAVLADNCAGLSDCWGTPFLAALSGGALPLLFAAAFWPDKPPPPKPLGPGDHLHPPDMPPGMHPPPVKFDPPRPAPDRPPEDKKRDDDNARKKKDYWDNEANRQNKDPDFPNNPDQQRRRDQYIQKQRDYWANPPAPSNDGRRPGDPAIASTDSATRG